MYILHSQKKYVKQTLLMFFQEKLASHLKALSQLLWRLLLRWKNILDWKKCLISILSEIFIPQNMVRRIYFCENCPRIFHSFTLSLVIPDKTKLNPWIFHTFALPRSLRNSKAKNKDPWKFHIIHILNSPVWIFSGIAQLLLISYIWLFFIIYQ